MNKIDKIEQLDFTSFKRTMSNLISRLDYKDVEIMDSVILSTQKSPLSFERYLFILFTQRLSGNVNINEIKEKILVCQKKNIANVLFLVSQYNISSGFEHSISKEFPNTKLHFIGRDRLIQLLDDNYSDFWKHEDLMLLEYEKQFNINASEETDLKRLKIFNDKYQKLLDIYIEPRIYYFHENKATRTPVRKVVNLEDLSKDNTPMIISGGAGAGKSTLLKKMGLRLIEENSKNIDVKNVPIFLTALEIYENDYKISQLATKKVESHFQSIDLRKFWETYRIVILIDSIDELDDEKQKDILKELHKLSEKFNIRYVIGTRNSDRLISILEKNNFNKYSIDRFNSEQVKKFVSKFFMGEIKKAENLIDALKENRIIEKLPITPLSLSLISILYEENNLEIPATIADIYDNFNSLIIGRSTVTSRIEFIDISFKERILSLYALHLLERQQHTPLSKEEFYTFFEEYFEGKTLPIKKGTLEEVLNYLIANTGVLILKDNKWVQFSHDSYMEFYGAVEIFKHQRDKEDLLVENFFENNWQNTSIFYAGKSKDMPKFLSKIIDKLKSAKLIYQYFSGVLGCGYLLQALYQTDNKLRKDAVIEALEMNSKANDVLMKLAADNFVLFKNFKIPILQIMGLMYFHETFNSITIKEPLKQAFEDTFSKYINSKEYTHGFKAIELALTLDSRRINEPDALERILENDIFFKDPMLYTILDFSFETFNNERYKKMKTDIRKDFFPKLSEAVKKIAELPASRLRFTNFDTTSFSKVKIIVEGKTDAEIIEHAYFILTGGTLPYWKIIPSGNLDSGGASEVAKALSNCSKVLDDGDFLLGLFDHDAKGLQEFRGLKSNIFDNYKNDTVRKHINSNIFAIVIPVTGEMCHYIKKEQSFNFFEIEHYFGFELLHSNGIIENTEIPEIVKIKDSKKKEFSKFIRTQTDRNLFLNFIELFEIIDKITGVEIDYSEL